MFHAIGRAYRLKVLLGVHDREVCYFHHVLAVAVRATRAGDDVGFERRGPAIRAHAKGRRAIDRFPLRVGRLDHQPGIQTVMLMSAWTEVIVSEYGAKCAILAKRVDQRISPPPLD